MSSRSDLPGRPRRAQRGKRRRSAAWRLAWPGALAFAIGSACALVLAYLLVASAVRRTSDAVLASEAQTLPEELAEVAPGELARTLAGEQAELERYLGFERKGASLRPGQRPLLLLVAADGRPLAAATGNRGRSPHALVAALARAHLEPGMPRTLSFTGMVEPLRIVRWPLDDGRDVYLALPDSENRALLAEIAATFGVAWGAMVAIGLAVSWTSVRRVLARVDRITETAAAIGLSELGSRLAEDPHADEIGRLVTTLNRMLERLETSVSEIRMLSDGFAHDLRSPITAVRGALEMALTRERGESWREQVEEALDRLDRLSAMVDSLLDLAEADRGAGALARHRLDVAQLAADLVDLYAPAAQEVGIGLTFEAAAPVFAEVDADLLRRLLVNLLDNLLVHLAPGDRARVVVEPCDHAVHLAVEDNGAGFAPEIRERAFERRVHRRGSPGHGLGLALVRAVARAHGGSATLSSPPAGGSRIEVRLPVSPAGAKSR